MPDNHHVLRRSMLNKYDISENIIGQNAFMKTSNKYKFVKSSIRFISCIMVENFIHQNLDGLILWATLNIQTFVLQYCISLTDKMCQ